jgi:hypothetical protein
MSEFRMLMALRTTFGPDSLLWNLSSREDLCYDWLEFRSQEPGEPFKTYARLLLKFELAHNPDPEKSAHFCERIEGFLRQCELDGITGRLSRSRTCGPLLDLSSIPIKITMDKPSTHLLRSG